MTNTTLPTFTHISDEIEIAEYTLRISTKPDYDMGAPWDEHDGHGEVSEWTNRAKHPGEWVLCRNGRSVRYYDYAGAIAKAKAEGWDAAPYRTGTMGERAERAVKADFKRLQEWADGEWCWIGVIVTALKNDIRLGSASLFGVESDQPDSILECANQLINETLEDARETLALLNEDIAA